MASDPSIECQTEQYRQAAEDLRHFDRFIWQQTVGSVFALAAGSIAILVRDISDGVRAGIFFALTTSLFTMQLALHKHRFGTDTRTSVLNQIEKQWVQRGLITHSMQRKTSLSEEEKKMIYEPKLASGLECLRAVTVLKLLLYLFMAAAASIGFVYLGAELNLWELPELLASRAVETRAMGG